MKRSMYLALPAILLIAWAGMRGMGVLPGLDARAAETKVERAAESKPPSGAALTRSAKSGLWSSAETWEGGSVPSAGSRVQVKEGHAMVYDVASDAAIHSLHKVSLQKIEAEAFYQPWGGTPMLVNGLAASPMRPNFAEWEIVLPRPMGNDLKIKAHAEDEAGNVEKTPHVVKSPKPLTHGDRLHPFRCSYGPVRRCLAAVPLEGLVGL